MGRGRDTQLQMGENLNYLISGLRVTLVLLQCLLLFLIYWKLKLLHQMTKNIYNIYEKCSANYFIVYIDILFSFNHFLLAKLVG